MSLQSTNRIELRTVRPGFFQQIIDLVANWNDRRMTRIALSKLTDRELNDIGLTRIDISNIR
ncbi:DUF1127 domain-containing protein [Thioclava sp. GXIMD4216]|uniref:DUF1127 domain-containing protein n=1 Tax=Thioclava litoralis TaxID=3076557 RepID=A0ABZ1E0N1_9RHOB|nr:DUF1127 domain-containing protein [Thioclava sp. FTW29]